MRLIWFRSLILFLTAIVMSGCGFTLKRNDFQLTNGGRIIHVQASTANIYAPTISEKLTHSVLKEIKLRVGLTNTDKPYSDLSISLVATKYEDKVTNEIGLLRQSLTIGVEAQYLDMLNADSKKIVKNFEASHIEESNSGFLEKSRRETMERIVLNSLAKQILNLVTTQVHSF